MRNQSILSLLFTGFIIILITISFQKPQTLNMTNFPPGDYEKEWKSIDSLENRGLPKSALAEVEKLYSRAKAENNPSQVIKSLIYLGKYQSQLEEEGFTKAVNRLEEEAKTAVFPVKEILESMLGQMYSNYADQNSWQFQNRTETLEFDNTDLLTWSLAQIIDKSNEHFSNSVQNVNTQSVPIDNFDAITSTGFNDQSIRPTLYDFLAFRAIEHFKNERHYLTEPSYKFYLDDDRALADAETFINTKFTAKDIASRKFKTVQLFQKLLNFHLNDKNPDAFIDADLKRLEWIHQNAVIDIKNDLYEKSLRDLLKKHESVAASAEISKHLASLIYTRNKNYKPAPHYKQSTDSQPITGKFDYKIAYEICAEAIKNHPNSMGANHCKALQRQILTENLRVEIEKVYLPNKPMLAKLTYRNFEKAYFKIIKIDEKTREKFDRLDWNKKVSFFNSLPVLKQWDSSLPNEGDYREHSVEFKIEKQAPGQYLLLTSDNSDFTDQGGKVNSAFFQISSLAYVQTTGRNIGTINFLAVDRNTGNPLQGVKATFFKQDYNRLRRGYDIKKVASATSDSNGEIASGIKDRGSFMVKFRHNGELLLSENWYGNYPNNNKPTIRRQGHFFLDRAIYRPGQTVYFKVLAVEYDAERMPRILKNHPVSITFKDANYQEVKTIELTTNEYGTVSGTFTAPKGGLLGRMTMHSIGGSNHSFRVEEYKRPKFEVNYKPIETSYRLDDQVKITGTAKAFAGNNIDGAEVTYRVVREVQFPYWSYWRWGWYNPWRNSSMEIVNGKTNTDEKGNFEIDFRALPDRSIPKDRKPEFSYRVIADVTDITGETRTGETNVRAGYVALELHLNIGEKLDLKDDNTFKVSSKNLNGAAEEAEIEIIAERLKAGDKIFNKRYWEKPDLALIPRSDFEKSFPEFSFGNEDEKEAWAIEKSFVVKKSKIKGEETVSFDKSSIKPGAYRLTAKTKDKYGTAIEVIKYFTAFETGSKNPPVPAVIWQVEKPETFEPGQTTEVDIASSFNDLCLYGKLENRSKDLRNGWLNCKNQSAIKHLVTEADRGGMGLTTFAVKNNRFYLNRSTIKVPWSNKELTVEYGTFRDKVKPGSEEEWVIKITGNKKEKVAAEFVAGMYDASLDAFAANRWFFSPFPNHYTRANWSSDNFQSLTGQNWEQHRNNATPVMYRSYRSLNWFNWYLGSRHHGRGYYTDGVRVEAEMMEMAAPAAKRAPRMKQDDTTSGGTLTSDQLKKLPTKNIAALASNAAGVSVDPDETSERLESNSDIPVRTNLNETVFFFPNLMTDQEGNVLIKFKMNEALTKWKFLGLAHTADLQTAVTENYVVTQKELMVQPNPPRFFREGDRIEFTAKVSNLTDKEMNGTAQLLLFDALTDEPIDLMLGNQNSSINFSAKAGQSDRLAWTITLPIGGVQAVKHRVIAKAGKYSDGEEAIVPVLTNRMMVTESMPLPVRGGESKTFKFKKLSESPTNAAFERSRERKDNTTTLQHHSLTLEYTSNPAWYAVQALPYLMEYPYECTEQIASRLYANSLATHVSNSSPKVKQIFDRWRDYEPDALKSNLSKNQELKTALLEETPWVLDAQSEEQQKKNIAILFDLNRMSYEQDIALRKLADRQEGNGGWSWFPGGRPNWYITQHVVESIGHLQRLGVRPMETNPKYRNMIEKAVRYCDFMMLEEYRELERRVKAGRTSWDVDHLGNIQIHYLYMRSFFLAANRKQVTGDVDWRDARGISMDDASQKAFKYYLGQAEKYWTQKGMYQQGMIALGLDRISYAAGISMQSKEPGEIVKSLKERSLNHEELGMYWKYARGYFWYQAPIETHALMIEVFKDVANDAQSVDDLKVWLLKNKQTNNWKTTKATAAAVYALLMSGDEWISESQPVEISFPASSNSNFEKDIQSAQSGAEAGTGYFKVRWDGKEVSPSLSNVYVNNPNKVVSWGSLYWQYFENLDKITTFEETPLTIKKQVFRVELSDTGEKIRPVSKTDLNVGDKLKVRIELRVDRDMEYVHMKDMRASGFEPMNVLSQYKWQGGLGYYESTRDASTNFFFDFLPKGTYVFEYPLRVVHNGDFSNGITTVQCMYAPEFSSHSEGVRFEITEK